MVFIIEEKALLTLKEVSNYLSASESTVRRLLKRKDTKFTIRIGNRLYANKKLLDEYLERCAKYNIPL